MKLDLELWEVRALIELFEGRIRRRWLHKRLSPNCKKCSNESTLLKKLKELDFIK